MTEIQYLVAPLSRNNIRRMAMYVRKLMGCIDTVYFPVMRFLEHVMPIWREGFEWEVVESHILGTKHAITIPKANKILIREDVYDGAESGIGRDRATILHECFHLLWHADQMVVMARSFDMKTIKPYRSSEWQAKAFAGEVLVPYHLCKDMTASQIEVECGVSMDAALYQMGTWKG